MLVGLTYDLRSAYLAEGYTEDETAEFDRGDTIDAIEKSLRQLGHRTVRIGHVRELIARLATGERWDLVFNICEGLHGTARESQVPCILDAYGIPYTFSDASVMALSLNKSWTKSVLAGVVPVAEERVIHSMDELAVTDMPLPLFAKPLLEGTGKGITASSVIRDAGQLATQCELLLDQYRQPVLVERYLPGREFTVSLVGTSDEARVLGTFEIILLGNAEPDVYGYLNKEECEERIEYRLVDPQKDEAVRRAEEYALRAWMELGCRDAGRVDLRADVAGEPHFIEVNPLAGMNPVHSDLPMLATAIGMEYLELIRLIVESASRRLPQVLPARDGRLEFARTA